jgi:aspartyl protease family protein
MRIAAACAITLAAALAHSPAEAQTVSMSGSLGDKALLVIDGKPRTVAAGATVQGVKLVSVSGGSAVVEVGGARVNLQLGGAQVNLGSAPSDGGGSQIVISAGSGGHFLTAGSINGVSVNFLVDTGATFVSMDAAEAQRIGIDLRKGEAMMSNTANGPMAAYRVKLASVRVGDVVLYDVDALVGQQAMGFVLLGNSFLTRFQMKRDNDVMTLTKRF